MSSCASAFAVGGRDVSQNAARERWIDHLTIAEALDDGRQERGRGSQGDVGAEVEDTGCVNLPRGIRRRLR